MKTAAPSGHQVRGGRAAETRDLILTAAERLFAEHGVFAVSNRQVSEAAGQGNNTAVGYHFGSKADLITAIVRKHAVPIERNRARLLGTTKGSAHVRDWVTCLVRPTIDHLAALGTPTWYARFSAQVMTDPALRTIMSKEALTSPSLQQVLDGLAACLPDLPARVRRTRGVMVGHLLISMLAERERALAATNPEESPDWSKSNADLIDAITGIWLAPVTS